MNMVYYGSDGLIYELGDQVNKGGEGKIYEVSGAPNVLAKILNEKMRTKGKHLKAQYWSKNYDQFDSTFLSQVAIPKVVLYSSNRHDLSTFVGYVMKRVSSFEPLDRIFLGTDLNYWQKVEIAKNLCILSNTIHQLGVTIGDYNPSNFAVHKESGLVELLDCDSLQFEMDTNGQKSLLACLASHPEIRAPEINQRLRDAGGQFYNINQDITPLYNIYTDRYALAFLIFSLLMCGSSPFAARNDRRMLEMHPSTAVVQPDEAAREGRFVFAVPEPNRLPPEYAPAYTFLSSELRTLFKLSFVNGAKDPHARPSEESYYNALKDYQDSLVKRHTKHNMVHYAPALYLHKCEFCRIDKYIRQHEN